MRLLFKRHPRCKALGLKKAKYLKRKYFSFFLKPVIDIFDSGQGSLSLNSPSPLS
jgi:hypothetical protein